jgi:hypothetical protein
VNPSLILKSAVITLMCVSFTFAQKPPKNPKTVSNIYTDFPLVKVVPAMKSAMESKGCHVTKELPPDKFQIIQVECSRIGPAGVQRPVARSGYAISSSTVFNQPNTSSIGFPLTDFVSGVTRGTPVNRAAPRLPDDHSQANAIL